MDTTLTRPVPRDSEGKEIEPDRAFDQVPPEAAPQAIDERDQQAAQDMHDQLEPMARQEYLQYMLSRTPVYLQAYMRELIEADFAPEPPPDPTETIVRNGDSVRVVSELGGDIPGSPGLAAVNNGTLEFVQVDAG